LTLEKSAPMPMVTCKTWWKQFVRDGRG
jgi:hypothetical protein